MSDDNNVSTAPSTGTFTPLTAHQRKTFLSDAGVKLLNNAIAHNQIPEIGKVLQGAEWLTSYADERLEKFIFQVSFLVTVGDKMLMVRRGGSRIITTGELAGMECGAILISHTVGEYNPPSKLKHILDVLNKKLPMYGRKHKLGIIPNLRFLGLVTNEVHSKEDERKKTVYYFYTFEANFPESKFNGDPLETLNASIRYATQDHSDVGILLQRPNEEFIGRIDPKNRGDRGALKLYLKPETSPELITLLDERGAARGIRSDGTLPFNNMRSRFFISHATCDYEKYVRPLCSAINRTLSTRQQENERINSMLNAACDINEDSLGTWTHEVNAVPGEAWAEENLSMVHFSRGFISVETPSSILSDNVINEIVEAILTARAYPHYPIIRLRTEAINRRDEQKFFKKIATALAVKLQKIGEELSEEARSTTKYTESTLCPLHVDFNTILGFVAEQVRDIVAEQENNR